MIESSRNLKIAVYVNFDSPSSDDINEAAILLLKGKEVIRGRLIGKNIDESDDELMEKIFTEETDKQMFDHETLKLGLRNVDTSHHDTVIDDIFTAMQSFKAVIKRIDGSQDGDDQYVIYGDNREGMMSSEFFYSLTDHIESHDENLLPTSIKDIYNKTTDIKVIFAAAGYTDIMYVESSAISNAAFIGIALDFSLGHR
jgi:hypothetical protein